jgi:hypothetical protein
MFASRSSIVWLDLAWLVLFTLWEEILADYTTEGDVGNRDRDDEADDLENASHLLKGHSTGAEKTRDEASDDKSDETAADGGNKEEKEPSFKILKFGGLFHRVI